MTDFKGKNVLVLGGSRGIGAAIVRRFASGGAQVAFTFGGRGITVNSGQPGPTDSDMNPANGPMADMMHNFMAIKRHATPAEVAELVAYIAGPHGAMITGSLQTIDGGFGA